eukprot:7316188-Pyramimonas_sp.AAC.1
MHLDPFSADGIPKGENAKILQTPSVIKTTWVWSHQVLLEVLVEPRGPLGRLGGHLEAMVGPPEAQGWT